METINIKGTLLGTSDKVLEYTLALPPLGQGGNAVVYRAHADDGTGGSELNYIIKILKPTVRGMRIREDDTHIWLEPTDFWEDTILSPDEMLEQRKAFMLNEARMMHELQLEGVSMNISAVFSYKNTLAVAMPCVGGRTLAEEDFSGMQDTNAVLSVVNDIQSIAEKIALLHQRGKLHMDISPDNLFRRTDNSIVLLDFGSVCSVSEPLTLYSVKEGFSAPEVCGRRGDCFGFEADIYSIGAVMYDMLFGAIFDPRTPGAYFFRCVNDLPINEGSRQYLRGLLADMLRLTPSRRMNDIHKLVASLKELRELLARFGVSPLQLLSRTKDCYDGFLRQSQKLGDILISRYFVPFSLLSEKLDFQQFMSAGKHQKNLLICGGNGSGKTTFMLSLWSAFLRRRIETGSGFIPLYVSLSDYPEDAGWRQGDTQESFILRQICVNCYGAANLASCPSDLLSGLGVEFAREADTSQYILLADGLDEVKPEVRGLLLNELQRLTGNSNLRIVITSRYREMALGEFDVIETDGIKDDALLRYLSEHGFSRNECTKLASNRTLMNIIRYPMYLSMICRLHDSGQNVADMTRTGRLLYRYFLSGKESERIRRIAGGRSDRESEKQLLLSRFYLPYMAFEMEKQRIHSVNRDTFEEWTQEAFASFSTRAFLCVNRDLAEVVDALYPCGGSDLQKLKSVNRMIRTVCAEQCLMLEHNECLRFVNLTMRTFFAALHIANVMAMAVKNGNPELLTHVFSSNWRTEVAEMAGDILTESEECPTKLVKQTLDLLRGYFGKPYAAVIRNVIMLLTAETGNLDGCDFSRLDLTRCELQGISCEHTVFDGARLTDEVLLGLMGNIYTSAVSAEAGKIVLFSGHGEIILADTQTGAYQKKQLESECDMVMAARYIGQRLFTVGRRCGYLTLCMEVFDLDCAFRHRFHITASHTNTVMSYQHVLAEFSPDGVWLAIANSPVYDKSDGEVLLINCCSGKQRSIMAEKGIKRIAFGRDKLYLINADHRLFCASLNDGAFQPDGRFAQVLDVKLIDGGERFMIWHNNGIFCSDGTTQRKLHLSIDKRMRRTAEFSFGDVSQPVCVCRLHEQNRHHPEMSIAAYFDDTPPRTVYATVISLISPQYALVSRHETAFGQPQSYIGIYDILHENWVVRVKKHRGMNNGMLAGSSLIMRRGTEAVVCDTENGTLRRVSLLNEKTRVWITADSRRRLMERTAGHDLELVWHDESGSRAMTLGQDSFGSTGKRSLSVLCVSADLRRLIIQAVCQSVKQLYVVSDDIVHIETVTLGETAIGETQAQLLGDNRLVLLSESRQDGQKKDILQWISLDGGEKPVVLDVSGYRLPSASLILMCYDGCISLVRFEQSGSDVPWEYGNIVISPFHMKNGCLTPSETVKFPCCCTNSARVECRYMGADCLIVKRRYTDQDFIAINLHTGEQRQLYLDDLQFIGSRFHSVTGLSEKCRSIMAKAGCTFSDDP